MCSWKSVSDLGPQVENHCSSYNFTKDSCKKEFVSLWEAISKIYYKEIKV